MNNDATIRNREAVKLHLQQARHALSGTNGMDMALVDQLVGQEAAWALYSAVQVALSKASIMPYNSDQSAFALFTMLPPNQKSEALQRIPSLDASTFESILKDHGSADNGAWSRASLMLPIIEKVAAAISGD